MSYTQITPTQIMNIHAAFTAGEAAFAFTACDAVNGNEAAMAGTPCLLILYNSDTSPHTVTIHSIADGPYLRTGDYVDTLPAGTYAIYPFLTKGWQQPDALGGLAWTANSALVKAAFIQVPPGLL